MTNLEQPAPRHARAMARAFAMDEQTWARHANPWSVWTRNTALPLLILSLWSRMWWGWWSLLALALALLWTWLNPRIFPVPSTTRHWASKAVLGERVWLNRDQVPIPRHHGRAARLLSVVTALGVPFVVWGVYHLEIWPTLFGSLLIYAGKLWLLDRMVWLYEDMKDQDKRYRSWLY